MSQQILSLEEEMKAPRLLIKPLGILNILFPFVILLYLLIGILGYYKYGEDVNAIILENFPVKSKYFLIYFVLISRRDRLYTDDTETLPLFLLKMQCYLRKGFN